MPNEKFSDLAHRIRHYQDDLAKQAKARLYVIGAMELEELERDDLRSMRRQIFFNPVDQLGNIESKSK
jgi:hypothetical protein